MLAFKIATVLLEAFILEQEVQINKNHELIRFLKLLKCIRNIIIYILHKSIYKPKYVGHVELGRGTTTLDITCSVSVPAFIIIIAAKSIIVKFVIQHLLQVN
jgi:hypothetical protein